MDGIELFRSLEKKTVLSQGVLPRERAIAYADRAPSDTISRSLLTPLAPTGTNQFAHPSLPCEINNLISEYVFYAEAQDTEQITDASKRVQEFGRLASHLPPGAKAEVEAHAYLRAQVGSMHPNKFDVNQRRSKSIAFGQLAAHLPPGGEVAAHADLREQASGMPLQSNRYYAFGELAAHLPLGAEAIAHADLSIRASDILGTSVCPECIAHAFGQLAAHLPPDREIDAHANLRVQASTMLDYYRSVVLGQLGAHLPPGAEAVAHANLRTQASSMRGDYCADTLGQLAQYLPLNAEATAHANLRVRASAIQEQFCRAKALSQLAEHLPPGAETVAHADLRSRVSALPDENSFEAFSQLAAHLPSGAESTARADLRKRARIIKNKYYRTKVFAEFAKHFPQSKIDMLAEDMWFAMKQTFNFS